MPENAVHEKNSSDSRIASLKQQNKEYKEMYRKWRVDHKDYGFFYSEDAGELAYRDGEGFITEYPYAAEKNALDGIQTVLADTLIIHTIFELAVIVLFSGLDFAVTDKIIYNSYGYFLGDDTIALIIGYILCPLVRLAPLIYLIKKLKLPVKLIAPVKISNKPLFFESIPMAMLIYGIGMVFSGLSSFIFSIFGFHSDFTLWIPDSKFALVLSIILYAFIIPIISEVIHRGLFMQILRQFGDGYALLLTSMIAALTTSGGKYMFTFVYSIVIGYFAMRTGSIMTAIAMRLVISNASYWLTYLKQTMPDNDKYLTISFIIAALFLLVGVSSIIAFSKKHSNKINLPIYAMYMSQRDKLICAVTNPRVIIWIALAILTAAASAALL